MEITFVSRILAGGAAWTVGARTEAMRRKRAVME
jgi:hypothetical protein